MWEQVKQQALQLAEGFGIMVSLSRDMTRMEVEQEVEDTFRTYGYNEDADELDRLFTIADLRG